MTALLPLGAISHDMLAAWNDALSWIAHTEAMDKD